MILKWFLIRNGEHSVLNDFSFYFHLPKENCFRYDWTRRPNGPYLPLCDTVHLQCTFYLTFPASQPHPTFVRFVLVPFSKVRKHWVIQLINFKLTLVYNTINICESVFLLRMNQWLPLKRYFQILPNLFLQHLNFKFFV